MSCGNDLAEWIAQQFHDAHEALAPEFGYQTREAPAVPWEQVPEVNRNLMVAVITQLLISGVIEPPAGELP